MNSTFVQFYNQKATYMTRQCHVWCMLMTFQSHYFKTSFVIIKWNSFFLTWQSRYFRAFFIAGVVVMIILVWLVFVVFIGFMSQITSFTAIWPRLNWIDALSKWFLNFLQNVISQVLMILLFILLFRFLQIIINCQKLFIKIVMKLVV